MVIAFYLIGFIVTVYLLFNLYIWDVRRSVRHFRSVPVKYGLLWFRGSVVEIRRRRQCYADAGKAVANMDVLVDISRETKWDIFVVTMLHINMIYVQDLEVVGKILPDRINFHKTPFVNKMLAKIGSTRVFGRYSIVSDPGTDIWAAKRKVVSPAFHRDFLRSMMLSMNQITDNLMRKLKKKAGGNFFNICKDFDHTSLASISVCGFDWHPDMVEKHGENLSDAVTYLCQMIQMKYEEMWTFELPWSRRAEKALLSQKLEPIRTIVRNHLKDRIERINAGSMDVDATILSYIIRSNQVTNMLTLEDIVDEYMTYLLAGMESTSIELAMATFYLSVNPEALARARDEVRDVLGERKTVTFDDLGKLVYLEMVIKETLRLSPPIICTDRVVVSNRVHLQGQYVPKGTYLKIPTIAIHLDPRNWEDPMTFNPDRFSPQTKHQNYSYMPFMTGPRNCVGKNFAMVELKMVLARLLQTFELVNPTPEVKNVEVVTRLTSRPKNGIMLGLILRED